MTGAKPPKLPTLEHCKFQRTKGRIYAYFNAGRKGGKVAWVPLPRWGTPAFFEAYAKMKGHKTRRARAPAMTVSELIQKYEQSQRYLALSKGSRETYRATLDKIERLLGVMDIEKVSRRHVREAAEVYPGGATRNMFISVVSVLYLFARRDLECTKNEPAKDMDSYPTGQHAVWPEELLALGLASDQPRVRLMVHLLYYTGQRIGDVLTMRWDAIKAGTIAVHQQKTSKDMVIPLLPELAALLATTPKLGETIVTGLKGRAAGVESVRQEIIAFAKAAGFDAVPHGLRRNAVYAMLYQGCSPDEVGSFTGQTAEIVAHYAKGISQLRLAEGAAAKMRKG